MNRIVRTNSGNRDFIRLVSELDIFLAEMNDREHDYYNQLNKIDSIKHVVLVYKNDVAASCGAMKEYDSYTVEVKRMFTVNEYRGNGYAKLVLNELENWAGELGYAKSILETGKQLTAAVNLYLKNGYRKIDNLTNTFIWKTAFAFRKF